MIIKKVKVEQVATWDAGRNVLFSIKSKHGFWYVWIEKDLYL